MPSALEVWERATSFEAPGHYTKKDRDKIAAADFAGPHQSYPIQTPQDVADAAHLVGHADNPAAVKRRIISIAKRKGASFVARLPKEWTSGKKKEDRAVGQDSRRVDALLYAPISRVDTERREVEGVLSSEALDTYETCFDYDAMKRAIESSWYGNVREQHDIKKAVGRKVQVDFDDEHRMIRLRSRVSLGAEDTWQKVLDGTLAGYSIGAYDAKFEKRTVNGKNVPWYNEFKLAEVSLVDAPSNPDAAASGLVVYRAADFAGTEDDETDSAFEALDESAAPIADEETPAIEPPVEALEAEADDEDAPSPERARAHTMAHLDSLEAAGYDLVFNRRGIPILRRKGELAADGPDAETAGAEGPASDAPVRTRAPEPTDEPAEAPSEERAQYWDGVADEADGDAADGDDDGEDELLSDTGNHEHDHGHASSYGEMHLHNHEHTHLDGTSHSHPHMHQHDHHEHYGDDSHSHGHTHVHDHSHTYRAWAPDNSGQEWQGERLERILSASRSTTPAGSEEPVLMAAGASTTPTAETPSETPAAVAPSVPAVQAPDEDAERRQRKMSDMAMSAIHHARDQLMRDCNCADCQDMLGICDPDDDGDDDTTPGLDTDHDGGMRGRAARLQRMQVARMTRSVVADELRQFEGVKTQLRAISARLATLQSPEMQRMSVQLDELRDLVKSVKGQVDEIASQPVTAGAPLLRAADKTLGLNQNAILDASAPNGHSDLSAEQEAYLVRMLQNRGYFRDQETQTDLAAKLIARQRPR